jgi:Tol biopolymer transport system component
MSPTVTSAGTTPGMILGTAAYMSPEQARGLPADRRSDVWAFGCTLYEMLTGAQPFKGNMVSDTLAAVLKTEPEWETLAGLVPRGIRNLLRRCLKKEARQRLHDIADARIIIEEVLDGASDETDEAAAPPAPSRTGERLIWIALLVAGIIAAAVLGAGRVTTPPRPHRKLALGIENYEHRWDVAPVISPDGRRIAYVSDDRLWIQDLVRVEPHAIDASKGATTPFWSPDSRWIGFRSEGKLWRAPIGGGAPSPIGAVVNDLAGATWGDDDTIVLADGNGPLLSVSARGGEPATFFERDLDRESDFHTPHFLPDGSGLVFAVHRTEGLDTLGALDSDGRRKVLLTVEGAQLDFPVYSKATGHLLWARRENNEGIWAAPFSLRRLELTGEPFLVAPGANWPSVSEHGHLVYVSGNTRPTMQLSLFDRTGKEIERIGEPRTGVTMNAPKVSPDGKRIAVTEDDGEDTDIWVYDLDRATRTRFTFTENQDCCPAWGPDGNTLYWSSGDGTLQHVVYRGAADGAEDPVQLVAGIAPQVTQDGAHLVFNRFDNETKFNLWTLRLDAETGEPRPLLEQPWNLGWFELSPDGRFVAYDSDESGVFQVFLMRFPAKRGKWQVSTEGGQFPRWTPDGTRLVYGGGGSLWEVRIDTSL